MSQAITGVGATGTEVGIERLTRVLSMQKNALNQAGENALKLIQSVLPPDQGQNLDVKA